MKIDENINKIKQDYELKILNDNNSAEIEERKINNDYEINKLKIEYDYENKMNDINFEKNEALKEQEFDRMQKEIMLQIMMIQNMQSQGNKNINKFDK